MDTVQDKMTTALEQHARILKNLFTSVELLNARLKSVEGRLEALEDAGQVPTDTATASLFPTASTGDTE